ncbi:beta-phosphoglucomutase [Fervidibacillus halotolerans]|uniref:Beta-phosphoglucomutase n=1 Tax=Fervidibacillus halotolerans TaxID=2980027 RepID=A0A9E8RY60_9BACI|nr:beta-phosphoglucomutase [Fervidibacillus halotolerans]WAA12511.1 beta-phosphoglucomutase [Fervidibacillus halotolerans]
MKEIKAIIFDLDGVITDTAEYHYLAWKQLGEELGIPFDRTFNEQLKGVSRMESLERILAYGNKSNVYTMEEKEQFAEKKNEMYKQLIQKITPKDLLPGIENFMREIKENGIKIGLASASKNAFTVIERLGVGHYFDTIVDAATVKNSKPDPEVFLKAADQLNVPYENCVGVEDAQAGVEAIKRAGMFAVGVGNAEQLARADLVVSCTSDLKLDDIKRAFSEN